MTPCPKCQQPLPPPSPDAASIVCAGCGASFKIKRAPTPVPVPLPAAPLPPTPDDDELRVAPLDERPTPKPVAPARTLSPQAHSPQAHSPQAHSPQAIPTQLAPKGDPSDIPSPGAFQTIPPKVWGAIAATAFAFLVLLGGAVALVMGVWNVGQAGRPADESGRQAYNEGFTIVAEAKPDWPAPKAKVEPVLVAAKPWDDAKPWRAEYDRAGFRRVYEPTPVTDVVVRDATANLPQWPSIDIPALPPAVNQPLQTAKGEAIPFSNIALTMKGPLEIVLAGLGEPLMLVPPEGINVAPISISGSASSAAKAEETRPDEPAPGKKDKSKSKAKPKANASETKAVEAIAANEKPMPPSPFNQRVIDARTGEVVCSYHWRVSTWNRPALSPDGKFLVAAMRTLDDRPGLRDQEKQEFGFDHPPSATSLAVFEPDAKNPKHWLEAGGTVAWCGFVGPRSYAALVLAPTEKLTIWSVETGAVERTIDFPAGTFATHRTENRHFNEDFHNSLTEFYCPDPLKGVVRRDGAVLALASADAPTVIDLKAGKVLGKCKVSHIASEGSAASAFVPTAMTYSIDGTEIWAISKTEKPAERYVFAAWRLTDGGLRHAVPMNVGYHLSIFPLADDRLWVNSTHTLAYVPVSKDIPALAHVVDIHDGRTLGSLSHYLFWQSGDWHLASTTRINFPGEARRLDGIASESVKIEKDYDEHKSRDPDNAKKRRDFDLAKVEEMDKMTFIAHGGTTEEVLAKLVPISDLKPRPRIAAVARQANRKRAPAPPASWKQPSPGEIPPRPTWDGTPESRPAYEFWPVAFNENQAACYLFKYHRSPAGRYELYWQKVDRSTGKRMGEPILLWEQLQKDALESSPNGDPNGMFEPVTALHADGTAIALADFDQPGRVDIFDDTGKHTVGFLAANEKIRYLAWPQSNRLWVLAGGSWHVVDPQTK